MFAGSSLTKAALSLSLRLATRVDAAAICTLVNSSYRGIAGERGWTSEVELVTGLRAQAADIEKVLARANSAVLVGVVASAIVACVHAEKVGSDVQIGLFSVQPSWQGRGIGKWLLDEAERYAWQVLNAQRLVMTVISQRSELISFYQRRGYRRTGEISPYPVHAQVGTPKVHLTVERLEKAPQP